MAHNAETVAACGNPACKRTAHSNEQWRLCDIARRTAQTAVPARHWTGMTLRDQMLEWRERALEAEAELARLTAHIDGSVSNIEETE